ncbi:helix-turn-helix transcriptional regulator [Acetonema longum]|uniref:helix-turn-helix transcriptional regulator n=1 Tax=Acetonema longum TaxID=2374 RepID=UPI0006815FCB|nr:helix-turn-helix transcriptional regulator [Acetonema longum]
MREKLTEFRGERTQEEMAGLYGVSQQLWSKWERGACCPSPAMMKQLEVDTGIPMETLFFDAFNNQMELKDEPATKTTA